MKDLKNDLLVIDDLIELVKPDVLDTLSMTEIKAGSNPDMDCECDHSSCNGEGTTLKKK